MTEILDAIELEMVAAVRRRNARARRRRARGVAVGAVTGVLAVGGVGVATVVDTPLDTLFPRGVERAQPAARTQSTVVVGDPAGVGWSVTAYRSRENFLSTVIVPRPRPAGPPPVSGLSGLLIALRRADEGAIDDVGTDVVERGGTVHVVVGGTVDEAVRAVAVTIDGRRYDATVAGTAVRVPVAPGAGDRVTPELERKLRTLPDEVGARAFGVALEPGSLADAVRAQATVETTLDDGVVVTEQRSLCVSQRCDGD